MVFVFKSDWTGDAGAWALSLYPRGTPPTILYCTSYYKIAVLCAKN